MTAKVESTIRDWNVIINSGEEVVFSRHSEDVLVIGRNDGCAVIFFDTSGRKQTRFMSSHTNFDGLQLDGNLYLSPIKKM